MKNVNKRSMLDGNLRHAGLRGAVCQVLYRHTPIASSAVALVLASAGARAQQANGPAQPSDSSGGIDEIVVTAQRRSESLQNVPYNISAIAGEALRDAGAISLNNLSQFVPGLENVDLGPSDRGGNNDITMRGLRTDPPGGGSGGGIYQNLTVSPVSTYFGETPVFFQMPLYDIERVEVLRGPQGTLYGSGAQAGTIRFIPTRPKFDEFSGEVSADGGYTQNAPNGNGSVHGVLNVPLADHLALRLVAGEEHLAGFINAVDRVQREPGGSDHTPIPTPTPSIPGDLTSGFVLGPVERGVNRSDQSFARVALRWEPSTAVDVQADFLHQHTSMADNQQSSAWPGGPWDSTFGFYPHTAFTTRPGCQYCTTNFAAEPFNDTINLGSIVATADLGLATITSASSYYDDQTFTSFDQTGFYYNVPGGSAFLQYFPYNNYPRLIGIQNQTSGARTFIEELRLVSTPGKHFDYVVGAYYEREVQSANMLATEAGINAFLNYTGQPSSSPQGDNNWGLSRTSKFYDRAVFGELTFHLTDAWQVTGGVRFFNQSFAVNGYYQFPLCGSLCAADQINPLGLQPINDTTDVSSNVKKINTSYDFSETLKVYATFSEGFRRGGVSGLTSYGPYASPANLSTFKPDLAKNYEIGVKGSFLDHRVRYFGDIYLINLYNFQFDGFSLSGIPGAYNGSQARSEGLEAQVEMTLTHQLSATLGYTHTKSYVTKTFDVLDYIPYAVVPSLGGTGQTASLFGGPISAGTKLPGVPQDTLTLGGNYVLPRAIGTWTLHADGSYRSWEKTQLYDASIYNWIIPSAVLVNARVTLAPTDKISYDMFVNNVTNNPGYSGTANAQTFPTPYELRDRGRPRTYGFGIRYRFGGH